MIESNLFSVFEPHTGEGYEKGVDVLVSDHFAVEVREKKVNLYMRTEIGYYAVKVDVEEKKVQIAEDKGWKIEEDERRIFIVHDREYPMTKEELRMEVPPEAVEEVWASMEKVKEC